MNKKYTRKIVLLSLAGILLVTYIFQILFTGRSNLKTLRVNDEITSLQINDLEIYKENNSWLLGEKKYPADKEIIESLINAIKEVKLLGHVTNQSESKNERYGLLDSSKIIVTAKNGEKVLRTLYVGKNTSTNSQCYISYDDSKKIYLAQGALQSTYSVELDSLRDRILYNFDLNTVTEFELKTPKENFKIVKNLVPASGDEIPQNLWVLVENKNGSLDKKLSDEKINEWLSKVAKIEVATWLPENTKFPRIAPASYLSVKAAGKSYSLSLFPDGTEESEVLASSENTPYLFEIQTFVANRLDKSLKDFIAE